MEFSSQSREMLLFLITNIVAVMSRGNQQLGKENCLRPTLVIRRMDRLAAIKCLTRIKRGIGRAKSDISRVPCEQTQTNTPHVRKMCKSTSGQRMTTGACFHLVFRSVIDDSQFFFVPVRIMMSRDFSGFQLRKVLFEVIECDLFQTTV